MSSKKDIIIGAGVVLALILSLVGLVGGKHSAPVGGITNYTGLKIVPQDTGDGFQLGTSGSNLANAVETTCAPKADVSITATSSGYAYCTGVTGVTSSDTNVIGQVSTSTAGWLLQADNFWVISAKASTTAGAVDFLIYNGSGKNAVPSAVGRVASTVDIRISH